MFILKIGIFLKSENVADQQRSGDMFYTQKSGRISEGYKTFLKPICCLNISFMGSSQFQPSRLYQGTLGIIQIPQKCNTKYYDASKKSLNFFLCPSTHWFCTYPVDPIGQTQQRWKTLQTIYSVITKPSLFFCLVLWRPSFDAYFVFVQQAD